MSSILVCYGTSEGQTATSAEKRPGLGPRFAYPRPDRRTTVIPNVSYGLAPP